MKLVSYITTLHHKPKDHDLNLHQCENIKFHTTVRLLQALVIGMMN
jgi:hypothetical protein